MEEDILKIIKSHTGFPAWQAKSAEAITAHVEAFIEWKDNQDTIKIYDDPKVYINLDDYKLMSLDEVYQHWWDKVKNK